RRHTRLQGDWSSDVCSSDLSGILDAGLDPTRIGVYLGCGEGSQDFASFSHMMTTALRPDGVDLATFARTGLEILNPVAEIEQERSEERRVGKECGGGGLGGQ